MTQNNKKTPALATSLLGTAVLAACLSMNATGADRILSVGDSIVQGTKGQCSFRFPLSQMMLNDPSADVEFVGSRSGLFRGPAFENCTSADFTNHFAESGRRADYFQPLIESELVVQNPDYVILHVGSNDMNQGQPVSTTIDEIDDLITRTLQQQPNATVLVGNIIGWDDETAGTDGVGPRIAALGLEVDALVNRRIVAGDSVVLVDVRNGFDPVGMTVDGIHPNNVGERFIADQFLSALADLGVAQRFEVPTKTIGDGEWNQISLPADPRFENTVAEILGDDLPVDEMSASNGGQGTWALVELVYSNAGDSYRYMNGDDFMRMGTGYWIVQVGRDSVTLDMPALALPTTLSLDVACASDSGCFSIPLRTDTNPQSLRYNLIGNPFVQDRQLVTTRAVTDSGDCAIGCAPITAQTSNVIANLFWNWDGANQQWRVLRSADRLNAWDAGFLPVLPGAQGRNPRLLFSAGN